jgi:hypothetical protein
MLVAASLALAALPAAASAQAVSGSPTGHPIEGVWSFSGGAVAIEGLSNGTYQGIVVSPTKFAVCDHPAGQVMWTGMKEQADGSFWGLHSWFTGGSRCEENPLRGLSAWRVLAGADGSRQLSVCFSKPGDASQPRIDPSGKCTGGTFGPAIASSPLAPLPGAASGPLRFDKVAVVPGNAACLKPGALKIKLKNPKYDPLREVVVKINGKQVRKVVGSEKLTKPIVIRKLPEGAFRVGVVATTVLGERVKGTRRYRACAGPKGPIKLAAPPNAGHI